MPLKLLLMVQWTIAREKQVNIFEYKTKITGRIFDNNNNKLDTEVVVPLKHLRNFGDLLVCLWLTVK